MEKKIRILQLAPQFPYPSVDGGKIGIANIIREFYNLGADVTFFCYSAQQPDLQSFEEASKYCKPIIFNHSAKNTNFRILKSILTDSSIYINKHNSRKIFRFIDNLICNDCFDIIHADHSAMAQLGVYIKNLIKKPLGLRLHNIEYMIWNRYSEVLSKWHPKRIYIKRQAEILRNYESKLFSQVDACFAITEKDKIKALELNPEANILVATAGVRMEEWIRQMSIEKNRYELIMASNYRWIHNIDAVRWLVQSVLPIVRKEFPEARLSLLGEMGPDWFNNMKQFGMDYLGFVPEVKSHLSRASVYVAPLFVGSGIRIKILEAMAMELPVVATSVSAEGINASTEEGLYIADDSADFATIIIRLLQNPDEAVKAGKAARKFISENYQWKDSVAIMLNEYQRLLK